MSPTPQFGPIKLENKIVGSNSVENTCLSCNKTVIIGNYSVTHKDIFSIEVVHFVCFVVISLRINNSL